MKTVVPQKPGNPQPGSPWLWFIPLGFLCVMLLAVFLPRTGKHPPGAAPDRGLNGAAQPPASRPNRESGARRPRPAAAPVPARSAEQIVAEKLNRFARQHQEIVAAWAKHLNVKVPEDVNRLFAAIQAGRWEKTTNLFAALKQARNGSDADPALKRLWPAIMETYGVALEAHDWPAQTLLNYGNAILGSLRPGMAYVGGTDPGRFIPTLLAETGDGEGPIVLTQNGLADNSYLDYLGFRYGDQMNTLTPNESQKAFQTYIADAQQRLLHDQQFPNEPPQLRPGEDVRVTDGRVQVGGQVAVMSINEQLMQMLLQKNPDLSFALEESFPFKSLYPAATTLGPVTEINGGQANPLTTDAAAQSLDYWRATTQDLLAETDTASAPRDAYAKLILAQANLFQDHNLTAEATQAYQLANSLDPAQPEAVFLYAGALLKQQRFEDAQQVAQTAVSLAPDNPQFAQLLRQLVARSQKK